ncbi:MAG: hypothetical protein GY822_09865 [Deltaproteobacteria bacterium]|nr:hypothetical protein [Deltaproteobacteria bacterium]
MSRSDGLVAASSTDWVCNDNSGQCEKTGAPEEGVVNGPCVDDGDCSRNGACQRGHCLLYGCATTGTCDGTCVAAGGNGASACLANCDSAADCFAGQACAPLDAPGLPFGVCSTACSDDTACKSTERCNAFGSEAYPICETACDPVGNSCGEGRVCEPANAAIGDPTLGFCRRLNQICRDDIACFTGQACEVLGTDGLGRCTNGCLMDNDCNMAGNEECVVQLGSLHGICRAPGGICAASPIYQGGDVEQPLLGDAQCIFTEECAQRVATYPATTASCVLASSSSRPSSARRQETRLVSECTGLVVKEHTPQQWTTFLRPPGQFLAKSSWRG